MKRVCRNVNLRLLVLALRTFAIGTASFVFAGLLGDVAGDLSVSGGTAGQLVTSYAVVYAVGSPILVTFTSGMARRRLLVFAIAVFVGANVAAVVIPSFRPSLASRSSPCAAPPPSPPSGSAAVL
jgi:MFS transporter, DHA1 family, inner membrane transport protein